ncbi:recombinase family protein [Lentzea sp. DG1S-22]|uniref:recombinase family protein n=1 Tax=Lentzea sp. DG1S-22 TaxID=3108822 RepID=UPI003FA53B8B
MTNSPPTPSPGRGAVGLWTHSNVRDTLTTPKYTGHMVWNRRARKPGGNARNPVSEWIRSPEPFTRQGEMIPLWPSARWATARPASLRRSTVRIGSQGRPLCCRVWTAGTNSRA